jgi:hypothetical protein
MLSLTPCTDPFSLNPLATRVRASSNFRFKWQFYQAEDLDPRSTKSVSAAVELIVLSPTLHQFLRDSFVADYDDTFMINPIHEHCQFVPDRGSFEDILASAANDHAGAYSRDLRNATPPEKASIAETFSSIGDYHAYHLRPGSTPGCPMCREHNNHAFTTWFYGVAWDWCLLAAWPERRLFWMGCLTDTD